MRRTPGWTLAAAVSWAAVLAGCEEVVELGPEALPPASIVSLTDDFVAVTGYRKQVRFQVLDADGRGVPGVTVRFEWGETGLGGPWLVETHVGGFATHEWEMPHPDLGTVALHATAVSHGGAELEPPLRATVLATPESYSPLLDVMLRSLPYQISASIESLRESLPKNPDLEAQIREKIALLEGPDFDLEIFADRRFYEDPVPSIDGGHVPVATVFLAETMREGASTVAATVEDALPLLEGLFDEAFPTGEFRVWYGFELGGSGGWGGMMLEDRVTYEARRSPPPYEAMVYHWMGHGYMGNETLTQLIELILFNVLRTGSTELSKWPYRRGYTGPAPSNANLDAALDIYGMIGYDAVARAYRTIRPLGPASGQPLCEACVQAFVDEAPADLKAAVEAKARAITL